MTDHPLPDDLDRIARALRLADFVLDRAETSLIAFVDERYIDAIEREIDRIKGARDAIADALTTLPPEPPMTPERQAQLEQLIGAVVQKRFFEGSQDALDGTDAGGLDRWRDGGGPGHDDVG